MMRPGTSAQKIVGWLAGGIALSLIGQTAWAAVQRYPKPKASLDGATMIAELAQLEAQQEEVLRRLDAAKKELAIIKVRASTIPSGICN